MLGAITNKPLILMAQYNRSVFLLPVKSKWLFLGSSPPGMYSGMQAPALVSPSLAARGFQSHQIYPHKARKGKREYKEGGAIF